MTEKTWRNFSGPVDLGDEVMKVVSNCASTSIFGLDVSNMSIPFEFFDGTVENLQPGVFLKKLAL